LRGKLGELAQTAAKRNLRGEITVVVGPMEASGDNAGRAAGAEDAGESAAPPNPSAARNITLSERVAQLMVDEGLDHKAALKKAGRERGLAKREAYRQLLLER